MPKFVIERQYLVPMYQHIVVDAENLEEACKKGISDDIDWDTQEMDCDSARATTITEAKVIPGGYELRRWPPCCKTILNRHAGLTHAGLLEVRRPPDCKNHVRHALRQQLKGCVASEPSGS